VLREGLLHEILILLKKSFVKLYHCKMSSILAFPFHVEMSRICLAFTQFREGGSRSSGVGGSVFMVFTEMAVNISNPAWDDDDKN
jgi:hypothetical protein